MSSAAAGATPTRGDFTLAPGERVFWSGETVTGNVPSADACAEAGPCFEYPLELVDSAAGRLRVAIDTPSRADSFRVELIDPAGELAASATNSNQFNEEAFVDAPAPGSWTVRVLPKGAERAYFRMRAKLERPAPPQSGPAVDLLPNLKAVPPFEFTFTAPLNPANGVYPPDSVNPPADVAGVHPISCTADEALPRELGGFGAIRCLRLTSGPINVGAGSYDMRFTFAEDIAQGEGELAAEGGTIQKAPMFQVVHRSDGEVTMHEAGTYSFHLTHAHFHDNNILTYELYSVVDRRRGGLSRVSEGTKSGFCPADQLFGEWHRFRQDPSGYFGEGDQPTGNCFSPTEGLLGLSRGWGDVYRWQRPGQYVEFAGQGDGLYVVRTTVDKPGEVLETDDRDNSAYALIRVVGERIDTLERGQGESPWDPRRVIFDGSGPASLD